MTGHTRGRPASLSVITQQEDGSVVMRRWNMCGHCADTLAAPLGEPDSEALVPPDVANRMAGQGIGLEGVIVTRREPS